MGKSPNKAMRPCISSRSLFVSAFLAFLLSQTMTSMTASHAQNTTSISALSAEQVQLDERETELRDIVTKAEGKRRWFADFRDWLESVATFLDEKVQF